MARVLRGDVVWADLNPGRGREQAGMRPIVVLSHDVFNERSGHGHRDGGDEPAATRGLPAHDGAADHVRLPKRSWVKISQVRTLSVERLGKKIGRVGPEQLDRLIEGLNEIVGR